MKKRFGSAMILLVFLLVASLFSLVRPVVFSQDDYEELNGYNEWTENKVLSKEIIINPDATLVIKKGVKVSFEGWEGMTVKGKLIVKGTAKEPVIFEKGSEESEYSIVVSGNGKADIRNADISGGGSFPPILIHNGIFVPNTANAAMSGAIYVHRGGKLSVQGSKFHDNINAIYIKEASMFNPINVNRSKFVDNIENNVICESCNNYADFRYNWWGDRDGPRKIYFDFDPTRYRFEKIAGSINFSNWATKEYFNDPVIIIPGIMGSWKWTKNGEWKLDPILHTYDDLVKVFEKNGYTENQDLFVFPYNWRASNIYTAQLLKQKIDEIKKATNWPKVDLVAHSMGGLVAREYVESGYYGRDVDQLLTLGTPHRGSPKSYLLWEGGEFGNGLINSIFERIIKMESKENGFDSIFDYVRKMPLKSVQELLPDYDYLKNADSGEMRNYFEKYPRNEFLENLNKNENISKLKGVEMINIFGKIDIISTLTNIRVEDVPESKKPLWPDGYPENYDSIFGDHGMEYGEGDETVPLFSAKGIESDEMVETGFSHGKLPTEAAKIVYENITGQFPLNFGGVPQTTNDVMIFLVFSPVDIQVSYLDRNGIRQVIGNNAEYTNEDGSFYAKYRVENENGEEVGEEVEFVTIPNPQDGEYVIRTEGNGNGNYRVEVTKISEDADNLLEARESTAIFNGIAEEGKVEELKVEVRGDEVVGEEEDETAPEITIASPEEKEYLNTGKLEFDFQISDDVSATENVLVKKYLDGKETTINGIEDFSLEKIGAHVFKIEAEDEAGNISTKEMEFEITTTLPTVISNIGHYAELKMIRKNEAKLLKNLVGNMIKLERILDLVKNSKHIKSKDKKKLEKTINHLIGTHIGSVIKLIERRPDNFISSEAKDLLVGSLEYARVNH